MQLSPFPCHLVPLRSKYSQQQPILKHPQPAYLPQCQRPGFTPIQNHRQNYSSIYLNLNFWIATWRTKLSLNNVWVLIKEKVWPLPTHGSPRHEPVSFTYPPVAPMWVVTLHTLLCTQTHPLPCHPPSYWHRLFSSQTFSRIHTPTLWFFMPTYLWRWNRECSETSAYKIQAPGNYAEESLQHSEHGESLKSRKG